MRIRKSVASLMLAGAFCAGLGAQGTVTVNFWTAPNQGQFAYWDGVIQAFNAAKVKLGTKTIVVQAQKMPETPSSEAGIQNALATKTAPALSENINRGFAATLAASGRVYDLGDEPVYKAIVASRKMETIMPGWAIGGKQYVVPLYANPMGYHWNVSALAELGFKGKVPTTVDDLAKLVAAFAGPKGEALKAKGVEFLFLRPQLLRPENWWDRWFDFQMEYEALTGGKSMVDGEKLTMDPKIAAEVFRLFGSMGKAIQGEQDDTAFERAVVPAVFQVTAPWDIPKYKAAGKAYGLSGDYVYGPPLVRKAGDPPYTFADAKGITFYKGGNVTDEQHKAAVAFVAWVFAAERGADNDLKWLKVTGMLPMRGDLASNPAFAGYIKENPEYAGQAEWIGRSVPAMASARMTEILTALGEKGLAPYIDAAIKADKAPDPEPYVSAAMDAMRKAGGLK
jgi:multiple sugar transport system substrate-binding protein